MSFWFYSRDGGIRRSVFAVDPSIQGFVLFIVILVLIVFAFAPRLF